MNKGIRRYLYCENAYQGESKDYLKFLTNGLKLKERLLISKLRDMLSAFKKTGPSLVEYCGDTIMKFTPEKITGVDGNNDENDNLMELGKSPQDDFLSQENIVKSDKEVG